MKEMFDSSIKAPLSTTLALCLLFPLSGAARAQGYKVVRVNVPGEAALRELEAMVVDVWGEKWGVGELEVGVTPAQLLTLKAHGLDCRLLIDDVQVLIDPERRESRHNATPADKLLSDAFFETYHEYAEILKFLEELVDAHPSLASLVEVGHTVEGRTIHAIRIANDEKPGAKPGVLYFSAEHCREWVTTMVLPFLARHILERYSQDSHLRDLVGHVEWYLIPVLNVDGYVFTWEVPGARLWRKNRRDNEDGTAGVRSQPQLGKGLGWPRFLGQLQRFHLPWAEPVFRAGDARLA